MNKKEKISFKGFIKRFPLIDLPIILGNDTHHTFSNNNPPLPILYIDTFISLIEGPIEQEFTEIIPCFSIPETKDFHAIVYWKAGLMDYQYILATYSKQGAPIARRVIGGTFSDGKVLVQSVATIDADWTIHIVTGNSKIQEEEYDATTSTAIEVELLADGNIVVEESPVGIRNK